MTKEQECLVWKASHAYRPNLDESPAAMSYAMSRPKTLTCKMVCGVAFTLALSGSFESVLAIICVQIIPRAGSMDINGEMVTFSLLSF
jgi:hypothetical protein